MIYFEDMSLEFFGIPLAWMPFFSAPDPSAKRKSGFLIPSYTSGSAYGFGLARRITGRSRPTTTPPSLRRSRRSRARCCKRNGGNGW